MNIIYLLHHTNFCDY